MSGRQGAPGAGSLAGLTVAELEALVDPPYRAKQIFRWIHVRGARSYDEMTDVPKQLREALAAKLPVRSSRVEATHPSEDGTTKLLLRLRDGESALRRFEAEIFDLVITDKNLPGISGIEVLKVFGVSPTMAAAMSG